MLYWVTHLVVKTFPLTEVQAAATYCPTAYWQLQPYASPCTYFLYQLVAGGWNRSKSRLGPNLPPISLTSHLWSNTVNLWPSFCRPPSLAPLACIVTFCEMRAICKWGNFSRIRAEPGAYVLGPVSEDCVAKTPRENRNFEKQDT